MVKSEELKEGNRVIAHDENLQVTGEWEVVEVDQQQVTIKNGGIQVPVNAIDVIPIPLTEELLKQIGFKFTQLNAAVLKSEAFILPSKTGEPGWYQDESLTEKCDYVHQLQNAFEKAKGKTLVLPALEEIQMPQLVIADLFKNDEQATNPDITPEIGKGSL